jgi:transmembrane sensor
MTRTSLDSTVAEALGRYWATDATPAETALAVQWLGDPANAERGRLLRQGWDAAAVADGDPARPEAARQFSDRVLSELAERGLRWGAGRSEPRKSRVRVSPMHRGAARGRHGALLGAIAMATVLAMVVGTNMLRRGSSETTRRHVTGDNQRATIALGDGSYVMLAPRSELLVSSRAGTAARVVTLSGEGYFSVAHSAGAPLVVRTGGVSTRVLGTAFDVLHDPSRSTVRVAVIAGRVAFGAHRPVVLDAGAIAVSHDSTLTVRPSTSVVAVAAYAAWTKGPLVFRDATVDDMLTTLGRWYGVDFRLGDSVMGKERVTATFDYSSRADVLVAVGVLLDVKMTSDGNVVTLAPRPRKASRDGKAQPRRNESREALSHSTEVGR